MREKIKIEQEKLKISKEKIILKREKFEYLKSTLSDYKDILNNVDYNVMRLREEVEKMAPSYLT